MEHIKRINRQLMYHGQVLDMYQDTILTPDGEEVYYDFLHHGGAAAVVPVLPDGRILMVRQYRNAINRETLEIPAGKLDFPEEDPKECAKRELKEETGYCCHRLSHLLTMCTTVALCDEKIEIYLAEELEQGLQDLDADEYINVEVYSYEALLQMILGGEIEDSKTIGAILAYGAINT